jgi:ATP-binding cassette, subfamily C (CFTR/MRP), member 4
MKDWNGQQLIKAESLDQPEDLLAAKETVVKNEDEHVAHGQVSLSQYLQYWTSGASTLRFTVLILLFLLTQTLVSGSDFWVSVCIARDHEQRSNSSNDSRQATESNLMSLIVQNWLGTYTILVSCLFVIALARSMLYFNVARRASKSLHKAMILSTMHAKMSFFLSTPTGRIINRCVVFGDFNEWFSHNLINFRFSSDLIAVDVNLPRIMLDTIQYFTLILGSFVIIFTISKIFIIPVGFFLVIVLWSKKHYLKTSRMLKRVDATMRSPIFTLLSDTIEGITSVRAFNKQSSLQNEMHQHLDRNFATSFLLSAASTSFGFLLDVICLLFVTILIVVFITNSEHFTSEQVGLAVTQAMSITSKF